MMQRRDFLNRISVGAASVPFFLASRQSKVFGESTSAKAKIAVIGVGNRGTALLQILNTFPDVEITAVCDLVRSKTEHAAKICSDSGKTAPRCYSESDTAWKTLLEKEQGQLDAVVIATGWDTHAQISLAALEKGIYVGCEVPMAMTVEDCWKLLESSQKNKTPCMMLENWSFRQDNLAVLNMIRKGLFGEIMHGHCAYSHFTGWYMFNSVDGSDNWRSEYLHNGNCNYYPTHALGPMLSWFDINVGDRFTEIYSVATAARGINAYMEKTFGPDHPNAKAKFTQGDVITSILKTAKGKTIVLNLDTNLPRPYANRWMVEGTLGVYDEEKEAVYLEGVSPEIHQWEPWKPYQDQYNHSLWKENHAGSHGGTDTLLMRVFADAVVNKTECPLDVYDSIVMSAVVELSGISIAQNRPVEFPDFTQGAWKTRKPYFALDPQNG